MKDQQQRSGKNVAPAFRRKINGVRLGCQNNFFSCSHAGYESSTVPRSPSLKLYQARSSGSTPAPEKNVMRIAGFRFL